MKRIASLFVLFLLALSGCAPSVGQPPLASGMAAPPSRIPEHDEESGPVLKQGKRLYIGLPQNATHDGRAIPGSGAEVSRLFAKHCKNDAESVTLAETPLPENTDLGEFLGEIQKTGTDYAIIPEIAHWEPRGVKRPVCVLAVAVYDVKTGKLLADESVSTNDPALSELNGSGNASLEDAVYRFLTWAFSGE